MKRLVITCLAAASLVAALPTLAVARHRSHRSHHVHHATHHRAKRVRHERFGQDMPQTSNPSGTTTTTTTTSTAAPETAGTVTGFKNGLLTIQLNDPSSSPVSGMVTDATRVRCEGPNDDSEAVHPDGDGGRGGSGSGDEGQDGSSDSGDDNGAENESSAQNCMISIGETVGSAELSISSAGAVWQEVELVPQSTTTTTTTSTTGSGD
jgi:hypothetical protein